MCEIVKGQNYTQQLPPWPITIQNPWTSIQSLVCLNWLYLCKPEGPTYQANNATRKQRNSLPISSRPIMLCNPVRCIFIHFCFNYLRDFGLARSLRVHELARSLWKACARLTPFNFLKNKFHRILKSIAGSFERGSPGLANEPLTTSIDKLYPYDSNITSYNII